MDNIEVGDRVWYRKNKPETWLEMEVLEIHDEYFTGLVTKSIGYSTFVEGYIDKNMYLKQFHQAPSKMDLLLTELDKLEACYERRCI